MAVVVVGLTAVLSVPAADSLWLAALGKQILHGHSFGSDIPYATAHQHAWANVPVLGELVFAAATSVAGITGLVIVQTTLLAAALALIVARCSRLGARDAGTAVALLAFVAGGFGNVVGIRGQAFSLVFFALLLLLLDAETAAPSRRVWLLVPLVSAWSMVHGAVLAGVAVALAWAVAERSRRSIAEAVALLVALPVAICLTPALWNTPRYYLDVMTGEAVKRRFGLWAPLGLTVYDVLLVAALLVCGALAFRARPRAWVWLAAFGLAVVTVRSPRNGLWLLMLLAPLAAAGVGEWRPKTPMRALPRVALLIGVLLVVIGFASVSRRFPASDAVDRAVQLGGSRVVLADPLLAERVAYQGGTVWIANPIEAFGTREQGEWLDWLQRKTTVPPDLRHRRVIVLVDTGSPLGKKVADSRAFRLLSRSGGASLYERTEQAPAPAQ